MDKKFNSIAIVAIVAIVVIGIIVASGFANLTGYAIARDVIRPIQPVKNTGACGVFESECTQSILLCDRLGECLEGNKWCTSTCTCIPENQKCESEIKCEQCCALAFACQKQTETLLVEDVLLADSLVEDQILKELNPLQSCMSSCKEKANPGKETCYLEDPLCGNMCAITIVCDQYLNTNSVYTEADCIANGCYWY